jgi:hypothetical protein
VVVAKLDQKMISKGETQHSLKAWSGAEGGESVEARLHQVGRSVIAFAQRVACSLTPPVLIPYVSCVTGLSLGLNSLSHCTLHFCQSRCRRQYLGDYALDHISRNAECFFVGYRLRHVKISARSKDVRVEPRGPWLNVSPRVVLLQNRYAS